MINNINLKDYPKDSGVYWFVSNNEVIYAGSSKNLYRRLSQHRACITRGNNNGCKQDLYKFLKENEFEVKFQLTENYDEEENNFIQQHKPRFNDNRVLPIDAPANTNEYHRLYLQVNKDYNKEHTEYCREWNKAHRDYFKNYSKNYFNRPCVYNNEELTFGALVARFKKQGVEHPAIEAKKYLKEV